MRQSRSVQYMTQTMTKILGKFECRGEGQLRNFPIYQVNPIQRERVMINESEHSMLIQLIQQILSSQTRNLRLVHLWRPNLRIKTHRVGKVPQDP